MAKYENDVVQWITVRGNHIPIKPGQTVQQAIAERFDDSDDVEIDIETEDLDKEIESDVSYYFTGYNPHEISREEYEAHKDSQYYTQMMITPEIKDLMSELLTEDNINKFAYGRLVIQFWDKCGFYVQGTERRAMMAKFKSIALKYYEKKAARVLKEIPKSSDNSSAYALKQNANGYVKSLDAKYNSKEYKAYTFNCQRCVIAYEMRRRSFDVEADAYDETTRLGIWHNNLRRSFLNFDENNVHGYDTRPDGSLYSGKGQLFKAMENDMLKEGEGARFVMEWNWKCQNSGHTVNAEVINGGVVVFDSQSSETKSLKDYLNKYTNIKPRSLNWTRVDKLKLSGDLEGVVKWNH